MPHAVTSLVALDPIIELTDRADRPIVIIKRRNPHQSPKAAYRSPPGTTSTLWRLIFKDLKWTQLSF